MAQQAPVLGRHCVVSTGAILLTHILAASSDSIQHTTVLIDLQSLGEKEGGGSMTSLRRGSAWQPVHLPDRAVVLQEVSVNNTDIVALFHTFHGTFTKFVGLNNLAIVLSPRRLLKISTLTIYSKFILSDNCLLVWKAV
jgi:hypothetical protein